MSFRCGMSGGVPSRAYWLAVLLSTAFIAAFIAARVDAVEFHISTGGSDANLGTVERPLRSIRKAAERMKPGDVCFVHGGGRAEGGVIGWLVLRAWVGPAATRGDIR